MMFRPTRSALLCGTLLLLAGAACAPRPETAGGANAQAEGRGPDAAAAQGSDAAQGANAVRAHVSEVRLAAGAQAEAVVRLGVAEGFHINSNDPGDKFLIPTLVEAAEPPPGLRAGPPLYPPGVTRKFGYSDKPLSVYEGEVSIRLPIGARADAARGRHTLDATVTLQPCTDTECFPQRTINAAIPVVVE